MAIAGAIGAIGLGLIVGNGAMRLVAGLYGAEGTSLGWILHIFHGIVFAVALGAIVRRKGVGPETGSRAPFAIGLAFAGLLWVVGWSVIGPEWLRFIIGFGSGAPSWNLSGFLGHMVYGLAVGAGLFAMTKS
jgi:hypothetical protein